ncbi:MAG: 30S ribosomal protein S3 [Candidatus Nanohalarchaeota archaeon]|nr:MAG: 30S ribosomal protein S3 [Candidatus Nanohaloarchaeota archaeon]
MIERKFIEKGIQKSELEKYLNKTLERADYSHSDIKRTPLNTRIVIYAGRPGVVIGHAGTKINEMTNDLKHKFNIDNPQIEVKSVANPALDAKVVAKQITSSLERGTKHRQIVNIMLKKIIEAGAIGAEITVSGKITGSRSRTEKFMRGYLKKCGNTADVHTQTEMERAVLKAGTIGVKVKLMSTMPSVLSIEKRILETAKEKEDEEKDKKAETEKENKDNQKTEPKQDKKQKKEDAKPEPTKEKKEKPKAKEPEPKKEEAKPEPKKNGPKEEQTKKQETEKKDETKNETPAKKEENKKTAPKKEEPKK